MGSIVSLCFKKKVSEATRELYAQEEVYSILGLKPSDLQTFQFFFQEVDADGSGEISLHELMKYLKLPRTKFNTRIFSIFDVTLVFT
eukprot:snap_masked-scaffold_10-processed-gene-11.34-mRNA-1 protein AED:0.40 eAED:0.40 QI:0/-1/0/1/-1/1/1/0/86